VCACMYVCGSVFVCACVCMCEYAYIYIYVEMCVCVCVCVYLHAAVCVYLSNFPSISRIRHFLYTIQTASPK